MRVSGTLLKNIQTIILHNVLNINILPPPPMKLINKWALNKNNLQI